MANQDVSTPRNGTNRAALDPVSRISEILFGLIMVLSFTGSLSATSGGREDIREMLIGAIGCNLAWGIIDAFFYLINIAAERGRGLLLLKNVKAEKSQQAANSLIVDALPDGFRSVVSEKIVADIREQAVRFEPADSRRLVSLADLRDALHIFALVFLSTFPVAVPFLIMRDPWMALRVSNLIALILMFSLGYSLGAFIGRRRWTWGLGMASVGVVLVSLTIALGG